MEEVENEEMGCGGFELKEGDKLPSPKKALYDLINTQTEYKELIQKYNRLNKENRKKYFDNIIFGIKSILRETGVKIIDGDKFHNEITKVLKKMYEEGIIKPE